MTIFQQTFRLCQSIFTELLRNDDWQANTLKHIEEEVEELELQQDKMGKQIDILMQQVAQLLAEAVSDVAEFAVTVDPPISQ